MVNILFFKIDEIVYIVVFNIQGIGSFLYLISNILEIFTINDITWWNDTIEKRNKPFR